ncbi:MAG: hypothetical protein AAF773_24975 [Cyanobacteria bacterium P01_D01_bin.115]
MTVTRRPAAPAAIALRCLTDNTHWTAPQPAGALQHPEKRRRCHHCPHDRNANW